MKPIERHPNLEPGRFGIVFESLGELDVLAAGLRYIAANRFMADDVPAVRMLQELTELASGLYAGMGTAAAAGLEFEILVPILPLADVTAAEQAVTVVATNAPDSTTSRHLQDPFVYHEAITMQSEYQAELARLERGEQGEQGGEPPAMRSDPGE